MGYSGKKGRERIIKGGSEHKKTDRRRLRQARKAAQRKVRKEKLSDEKLLSRLKPGLGLNNPYEKRKMINELKEARGAGKIVDTLKTPHTKYTLKSSKGFFRNMQRLIEGNTHLSDDDQPIDFSNACNNSEYERTEWERKRMKNQDGDNLPSSSALIL